jgi:hypothetical protein
LAWCVVDVLLCVTTVCCAWCCFAPEECFFLAEVAGACVVSHHAWWAPAAADARILVLDQDTSLSAALGLSDRRACYCLGTQ